MSTAQRNYQPWSETERRFIVDTHATMSAVEQAQALQRDYDTLCWQRQRLIRAGLIAPEQRAYARVYTDEDRERIVELAQAGYSVARIGRALGRSYWSIISEIRDMGGIKALRGNPAAAVRTPTETAELLGLTKHTVDKWIRRGWIASTRNTAPRRNRQRVDRLITDDALLQFMTKREYWPAWHPADITDLDWQEHARHLRADGDWIGMAAIARRSGVPLPSVYLRVRNGSFADLCLLRYGNEWLVWSGDAETMTERVRYEYTTHYRRQKVCEV